jgi:hypothetical protein
MDERPNREILHDLAVLDDFLKFGLGRGTLMCRQVSLPAHKQPVGIQPEVGGRAKFVRSGKLQNLCYRSSISVFFWTLAERFPWCSRPVPRRKGAEGVNPGALTPTDGAFRTSRWTDDGGRCDRSRTLIRHAEATAPLAIRSLPMAVFQPARPRALIAAIGRTSLLAPSCCSAGFAAVALAMVAMAADEKDRATAGGHDKSVVG